MDEKQIPQPCDAWSEMLATAQLDDLPIAERKALANHLLSCPACTAVWTDYCFLQNSMRRLLAAKPLSDLPPSLLQQSREHYPVPKILHFLRMWLARAWPIVLSLLVGLLTFVIGLNVFHLPNGDLKTALVITLLPAIIVSTFILITLKWNDIRFRVQSQRLSSSPSHASREERKKGTPYEQEQAANQDSLLLSSRSLLLKRQKNKKGWRDRSILLPTIMVLTAMMIALLGVSLLSPSLSLTTVTNLQDNGAGSLRQLLADAKSGSIITFAPSLQGNLVLSKELDIEKNVTIVGPNPGQIRISNGHHANVHVHIHQSATVSFSRLTFADSLVSKQSFIYNEGNLTLNTCWVQQNISYDDGGGITNQGGTLTITDSHISQNFASGNGGGINDSNGILTITGSTISSNTAFENGGGISGVNGSVNLGKGTIVSRNQVLHNTSSRGGGIVVLDSLLDITGSTIQENWTPGTGGGISILGSQAFVTSSVIVGNKAERGRELAVEMDSENKKSGLMILGYLTLPPYADSPTFYVGRNQDKIPDIIQGQITYESSRPQIESISVPHNVVGNPAPTQLPPEESTDYRGNINIGAYCQQLGYQTFDDTRPFHLICIDSNRTQKAVDALQICQAQYDQITASRLANYFDPTSWQCYAHARYLGLIASTDIVNFCQSIPSNLRILNNERSTAYDWKCLHRGGTLGYYPIHMDNFPVGLSVTDMCRYVYANQVMPDSFVMDSLTDYNDPFGWACWELP
jgi:hypothetical protein